MSDDANKAEKHGKVQSGKKNTVVSKCGGVATRRNEFFQWLGGWWKYSSELTKRSATGDASARIPKFHSKGPQMAMAQRGATDE